MHCIVDMYRIYLIKSRAHINAWGRINTGVQRSKVSKHPAETARIMPG